MEFKNLCQKPEYQDITAWMNEQKQEMEEYINFVLSLTDRPDIKNRILKMKEDLICYIVDSKRPKIPRILTGNDCSFSLPYRAVAFVREQLEVVADDEKRYDIKCGLAYRIDDTNPGVKFHELNHNISQQLSMQVANGNIMKWGTEILVYDLDNDKWIFRTGDFLCEALTDAIAKYYYEKKYETTDKSRYSGAYREQCVTLFGEILLGRDLSNKDLINAYLGDPEDLRKFVIKFSSVTGFDFNQILKMSTNIQSSIDNVFISDMKLIKLAISYRINSATNEDELDTEIKFLQSLNILQELKANKYESQDLQLFLNSECENARQKLGALSLQ